VCYYIPEFRPVLLSVLSFILHAKKTAFVIEHDFIMATYLADRVIVFEGQPAISATATP
jgi:ATP-binding cassette subfamily E protein 1